MQVFACVSATCGRFYHPHCVTKLLHPRDEDAVKELQKSIAEGKSFTCPIHKCCVCGKGENKKTPELQFAVCRRCPSSYHRKCLPKYVFPFPFCIRVAPMFIGKVGFGPHLFTLCSHLPKHFFWLTMVLNFWGFFRFSHPYSTIINVFS